MKQEIRFCSASDGVRIAYSLAGKGTPVVKVANWLNHLEFDWESPVWRHTLEPIARRHLLVRYDERGNGLSDWDVSDLSFDAFVRDLETVVDAVELDRFALFGISQGCAVSIAYAVRHPKRVSRLVLFGGYARGWRKREDRKEIARREALDVLMETGWGQDNPAFRQTFTSLFVPDGTPEQMQWFNDLQRVTTSPNNAVRLSTTFSEIDVVDLLERVHVPTLVLHAKNDARVSFEAGRELATGIPGARFVPLESRNHLILGQEPAWAPFIEEILTFLESPRPALTDEERAAAKGNVLHTPTAWAEADRLFDRALDVPAAERAAWLDETCGTNEALRQQVERLLAASDRSGPTLATGGAMAGSLGGEVASGLSGEHQLSEGDVLGSYTITGPLGKGGMGTVYRARHEGLGRDVAVKALSHLVGADEADVRRFQREAQLLASLNHPNIATVYDRLVIDGRPYLVMELVDGPTLRDRLTEGAVGPDEAMSIASQLVDALEEAHQHGVVHRDLKPANVKLTPEGRVKVLDFGLAKSIAAAHEKSKARDATTKTGVLLGTPGYMSPEQVRADDVDARADYWALGCIVYEMLTGVRAIGGATISEAVAAVLRDDVDWERVPSSSPPGLVTLMKRCLEKDRNARIQDSGEARAVLASAEPRAVSANGFWLLVTVCLLGLAALVYVLAT